MALGLRPDAIRGTANHRRASRGRGRRWIGTRRGMSHPRRGHLDVLRTAGGAARDLYRWGATVRVGRIIGPGRMVDMMLAARTYDAERALQLGLCHEVVSSGLSVARAMEIAEAAAKQAPLSNYAMV